MLLPFLDGGENVPLLERALTELRRHALAPDLELKILVYLVQKVGGDEALQRLGARLDMAMLRQTNVFQEFIDEAIDRGVAAGPHAHPGAAVRRDPAQCGGLPWTPIGASGWRR